MSDHASFLAAICAHPDEDAPRLIYADWLEEQGDADRAEFIRVQCELAMVSPLEPRWLELDQRAKTLRNRHEGTWTRGLRELVLRWRFERGFVSWVELRSHKQPQTWEKLFQHHPIQHVRCSLTTPLIQKLCSFPAAANLRGLSLRHSPLGRAGLQYLIHSPFLHGLRELSLYSCQLTDKAMADLLRMPCLDRLEMLSLGFNARMCWNPITQAFSHQDAIGDAGLLCLLDSGRLASLRYWSMRNCGITDEGASALLTASVPDCLDELHLEENAVSRGHVARLRQHFGSRIYI